MNARDRISLVAFFPVTMTAVWTALNEGGHFHVLSRIRPGIVHLWS
jgi:hypothetical protein